MSLSPTGNVSVRDPQPIKISGSSLETAVRSIVAKSLYEVLPQYKVWFSDNVMCTRALARSISFAGRIWGLRDEGSGRALVVMASSMYVSQISRFLAFEYPVIISGIFSRSLDSLSLKIHRQGRWWRRAKIVRYELKSPNSNYIRPDTAVIVLVMILNHFSNNIDTIVFYDSGRLPMKHRQLGTLESRHHLWLVRSEIERNSDPLRDRSVDINTFHWLWPSWTILVDSIICMKIDHFSALAVEKLIPTEPSLPIIHQPLHHVAPIWLQV